MAAALGRHAPPAAPCPLARGPANGSHPLAHNHNQPPRSMSTQTATRQRIKPQWGTTPTCWPSPRRRRPRQRAARTAGPPATAAALPAPRERGGPVIPGCRLGCRAPMTAALCALHCLPPCPHFFLCTPGAQLTLHSLYHHHRCMAARRPIAPGGFCTHAAALYPSAALAPSACCHPFHSAPSCPAVLNNQPQAAAAALARAAPCNLQRLNRVCYRQR